VRACVFYTCMTACLCAYVFYVFFVCMCECARVYHVCARVRVCIVCVHVCVRVRVRVCACV
jgi:hypothetical protein